MIHLSPDRCHVKLLEDACGFRAGTILTGKVIMSDDGPLLTMGTTEDCSMVVVSMLQSQKSYDYPEGGPPRWRKLSPLEMLAECAE